MDFVREIRRKTLFHKIFHLKTVLRRSARMAGSILLLTGKKMAFMISLKDVFPLFLWVFFL